MKISSIGSGKKKSQKKKKKGSIWYNGIVGVKKLGVKLSITEYQKNELQKCMDDPFYFIEKYVKLRTLKDGITNIKLRSYQKDMIKKMFKEQFTITMMARQMGKTSTVSMFFLWNLLFNDEFSVLVLANVQKKAKEVIDEIKIMIKNLPVWLQEGVEEWNKLSIKFENGSKISAEATKEDSGRGSTHNIVYIDEMAFIRDNIISEMMKAVLPIITSDTSGKSKIIITSTPKGRNYFWKMYMDAKRGYSIFKHNFYHWTELKTRDEKFKQGIIDTFGQRYFSREFECVGPETEITVRDKGSGEIKKICISDLYEEIPMFVNSKYDILTPNGFEYFDGIHKVKKDSIKIEFDDDTYIICSNNHKFIDKATEIVAGELLPDSNINNKVVKKVLPQGNLELYDIINSGKDHTYITNGLVSHNCSFDGTSETFLQPHVLELLIFKDPIKELKIGKKDYILKQYEKPILPDQNGNNGHNYILTLDPSEGIGQDYTGIHVWDISEKDKRKQVATMYTNTLSEMEAPYIIVEIGKMYNNALVIAENNKCERILDNLLEKCDYDNIFFNELDNRYGIRMSEAKKRRAIKQMEIEFEKGRVEVNDYDYIHELSVFVQKGKSYEADDGEHDDLVMSSALLFWLMSYDNLYKEHISNKENYMKSVHGIEAEENEAPLIFFENGIDKFQLGKKHNYNYYK